MLWIKYAYITINASYTKHFLVKIPFKELKSEFNNIINY